MATTPNSESSRDDFTPAYVVGVTGHMNLPTGEVTRLKQEVRAFFLAMMDGEKKPSLLPAGWVALKDTPILVLSNLAPGADTLVAEVALELKQEGRRIQVKGPLAYPPEIYPLCTSFKVSSFHPGAENAARLEEEAREKFTELKKRIGTENLWAVELAEDLKNAPTDEALKDEATATDEVRKQTRRRRYAAAGEHVATYCNLLIAIWEMGSKADLGGSCATAVGKLEGFVPAHLPNATGFTWTPTGAVAHFPCTRMVREEDPQKAATDVTPTAPAPASTSTPAPTGSQAVHFLYPGDLAHLVPGSTKKGESAEDATARRRQFACKLVEGAKCLVEYNEYSNPRHAELDLSQDEINKVLANEAAEAGKKLDGRLPTFPADAQTALVRLGSARRRAADGTARLTRRTDHMAYLLFAAALGSALTLHFWVHPPFGGAVQCLCLGLSVFIAWLGYREFHHYEHDGDEARDHDWRVLAEGLRVQLFWAAAGIERSVAASYMQRHRGELNWIRMAVSSLAAPYHRWKVWFGAVETPKDQLAVEGSIKGRWEGQLAVLGAIKDKWLKDQRVYFTNESAKNDHKQHSWGELASTLVVAAFALAILAEIARLAGPPLSALLAQREDALFLKGLFFAAVVVVWSAAMLGLALLAREAERVGSRQEDECRKKGLKGPLAGDKRGVWRGVQFLLHWLFPTAAQAEQSTWAARLRKKPLSHAVRVVLATLVAMGCLLASEITQAACDYVHSVVTPPAPRHQSHGLGKGPAAGHGSSGHGSIDTGHASTHAGADGHAGNAQVHSSPAATHGQAGHHGTGGHDSHDYVLNHFSAIWVGTLLLFGALAVAWREARLYSEYSRQYHTMASLYLSAEDRTARHLEEMRGITDAAAFQSRLAELRQLLIAVGEEALDENAEWLILHRARPLEPVHG